MARLPSWAFVAAAIVFIAVPGHPDAWFRGLPVGLWMLVPPALLAFAWRAPRPAFPNLTAVTAAVGILVLAKIAVAAIGAPAGWLGQYYANGEFAGAPRRSTAFPRLVGATRVDRSIAFHDDGLPLYFLNDTDFNRGIRREVTEPVSVRWIGHMQTPAAVALRLSVETRGTVRVAVDGTAAFEATTGSSAHDVRLPAGDHVVEVRYVKPADTDPLVRVAGVPDVAPWQVARWRLAAAGPVSAAARAVDVAAAVVFAYALWLLLAGVVWSPAWIGAAAMLLLLIGQGLVPAADAQHRAVSLSGGDDWLGFEARGRAVATGDVLQLYGQPLGKGDAFYYYPGYSYFLAAVHVVGSEDLSAPIFANFLLLFAANVLVFQLAARLFGRPVAFGAAAFLLAIEEVAFVRHYTVTLLSENLYFFTSVVVIDQLVRFAEDHRRRHLVWAGIAGGVSSMIRPAMMLYLGPAALMVAVMSLRARRDVRGAVAAMAVLCAAWLAAVLPATARNYVASGSPVLISTSPSVSFINYNMPPNVDSRVYRDQYISGKASAAMVLVRILIEHPADTLRGAAVKLGFSMGLLQLMGGHLHPELVAASVGYFLALLLCPAARSMPTWPIHAFVLAHLAGMVLTMPSNYGYRLILPMYLFFPMFAVFFAVEAWRWMASPAGRRDVVAPGTAR